jgi:hypothetical protein
MEARSIEAIVRALNDGNVHYLIVGGLAVNAHGFERLTRDLDLVIGLETENISRGLRTLIEIGYTPSIPVTPEEFANADNREMWRRDKNMLVLKLWSDTHQRTPIDLFVYEPFDFEAELASAVKMEIARNLAAPFVTRKTLIEMKRVAGRPQDLTDIAALEELQRISEDSGHDAV